MVRVDGLVQAHQLQGVGVVIAHHVGQIGGPVEVGVRGDVVPALVCAPEGAVSGRVAEGQSLGQAKVC
jgi:hypothetical protein